jgi:hypothetical protein
MRFSVYYEVAPEGIFGVPQAGMTVLPAGPRDSYFAPFTNTGIRIGHGTLSEYRPDDQAVRLSLGLGDASIQIEDNFFTVTVEADDAFPAYTAATRLLESVLANLALDLRHAFSYYPLEIRDVHGTPFPAPKSVNFGGTNYNLGQVAEALRSAATFTAVTDDRLDRALHYFEHALFLFDRRSSLAPPLSRHHRTLISSIFLNFWKAVTTIVGDPSRDADYQRRYRQYGMDHEFWQTRIERLRTLRNDFDVAHYALNEAASAEIEAAYGEGVSTAAEVIRRYRAHSARAASVEVQGQSTS